MPNDIEHQLLELNESTAKAATISPPVLRFEVGVTCAAYLHLRAMADHRARENTVDPT